MDHENQAGGPPSPPAPARTLGIWVLVLGVLGVGGLVLGLEELPAMVAFAGLFLVAQAADADPRWLTLESLLGPVVPFGGALAFAVLAAEILRGGEMSPLRVSAAVFSGLTALFSLLTMFPAVARALTRRLFGAGADSHTLRLAARVTALTLLLAPAGALVFPAILEPLLESPGGLIQPRALGGELVGYVALALAGVGFLVRRDLRATLERLGLRDLSRRDLGIIAAGALLLFAFNGAAEWLQRAAFHATWTHDQRVNQQLVRGLTLWQTLLLGLTAGMGEEITLRGALQPRLGLWLTSALFASLHVQYSWYGMVTIMAIGLVLGVLRQRTSTTVCVVVHGLYDIAAVFGT
jgi:hypothetical protein